MSENPAFVLYRTTPQGFFAVRMDCGLVEAASIFSH
jgi:hypothetical protein